MRHSMGNGKRFEMARLTQLVSVSLPVILSEILNMSLVGVAFPAPPEDALAPFQGCLSAALWQRCDGVVAISLHETAINVSVSWSLSYWKPEVGLFTPGNWVHIAP